jgi:uncharacterized protein YbbC (DUF1343 family)
MLIFRFVFLGWFFLLLSQVGCTQQLTPSKPLEVNRSIATGASQLQQYLPDLANQRVTVVANQTSMIGQTHLVDTLISLGVNVVSVFAPEHGFRGDAGAGETIKNGTDAKTGLPLISLYGKNKKPTPEMLRDTDVLVFDIQDVGARFYTYISTMHYVMEAAVENNKKMIILDRPNPNGFYVDGPVLDPKFKSFVGMHPIPVVHGLTVGELAGMILGEGWIKAPNADFLKVVKCQNYTHSDLYELPVRPSPNLPNMTSIYLYPSLCWFEGTTVSVGRGTEFPFQIIGFPGNKTGKYEFTPLDLKGIAMDPPHEGKTCTGHDLREFGSFYFTSTKQLYLEWITGLYENASDKKAFFTSPEFFDKLAGTDQFRMQLIAGKSASEIRQSWQKDLENYRNTRKNYLLYPDF